MKEFIHLYKKFNDKNDLEVLKILNKRFQELEHPLFILGYFFKYKLANLSEKIDYPLILEFSKYYYKN